ncbi:MAG TPA: mitochondrial fission ELM1 family protein [Telmatospirillum sp.]|nr:mitochondrial fission ELM1 family protein [Telmatospirillum sp.]
MAYDRVWVLADDRPGNVTQALGVAEALGEPFRIQDIRYDRWGGWHNALRGISLRGVTAASRASLAPPWPALVIGAGRRTAPVARWIKRQSACRLVQLMDPGWPGRDDFDLIVAPQHDGLPDRPNVLHSLGACHRASCALLAAEGQRWAGRLAHLKRPYLVVVVGGATKDRAFGPEHGEQLAAGVAALHEKMGGSILVTTSRRTPAELTDRLIRNLPQPCYAFRWRDGAENPYLGFLALADSIVVTGDSMNMCSEACANGGPVYIFAPPGFVSDKHARLHRALITNGYARPFGAEGVPWAHPPLNAAADVAREIKARGLL